MFRIDTKSLSFPHPEYADADGLLGVGGDLSPQRLLLAYQYGIFPWYSEGQPPLWWSPDPRFVLFPEKAKISKTMRKVLQRGEFEIHHNKAFEEVIQACATTPRPGQEGTWLIPEMQEAYLELHKLGYAHSVEAWKEGKLLGGLYGIKLKNCFFGESMFAHAPNASKAAFLSACQQWAKEKLTLIDCQVYTSHLESLGAEMIPRRQFLNYLGLAPL